MSALAANATAVFFIVGGLFFICSACAPEGSRLEALLASANGAGWACLGAARLQWVGAAALGAIDWFMNRPHPVVQVLYVLIVGGSFAAFAVHGFPELAAGANPYFAAHHLGEAWALLAATLVAFAAASFTDPGRITPANARALADAYPCDDVLYVRDGRADCATCHLPRPARSKHCPVCGHCVARFDHHCIWLNACVGERNYRWFILFLVLNVVLMSCVRARACACAQTSHRSARQRPAQPHPPPQVRRVGRVGDLLRGHCARAALVGVVCERGGPAGARVGAHHF
jgi:hypothetical protein